MLIFYSVTNGLRFNLLVKSKVIFSDFQENEFSGEKRMIKDREFLQKKKQSVSVRGIIKNVPKLQVS